MDTNTTADRSPLSRFLNDDNITIMESLLPYCSPSVGRTLAIQIKLMELQKIFHEFHDGPFLRACGLEGKDRDLESMLRTLKNSVSEEKATQINQILQMMQFSRLYQQFSEISREHPELFGRQENPGKENAADTPDLFSDPSLFLMLSSMMNNEENSNDKMKKLLDIVTSGSGENKDMAALLSSLLKKQG
jgi:hypothetical protein